MTQKKGPQDQDPDKKPEDMQATQTATAEIVMKRMKNLQFHRWFHCMALLLVTACILQMTVLSSSAEEAGKTGSITIHELAGDDHQTAVGGIRLSICKITNTYEEIRAAIDAGTPESLVPEADRVVLDSQVTDSSTGTVVFSSLERGVYLIWQTNQADDFKDLGYTAECEAFLVEIPKGDETGNEEWDVNCSPKVRVDRTPETTQVMVLKKWEDNFDALELRPTSIEVGLYKDGALEDTVTLSAQTNWQYSWTGLAKDVTWTVKEIKVPKYYSTAVTSEGLTFTITNTLLPTPDGDKETEKETETETETEKPPTKETEPGNPGTPPSTPVTPGSKSPVKTGDTTPIMGTTLLLITAGLAIVLIVRKRRLLKAYGRWPGQRRK